jgi:hypothetical protein
MNERWPPVHNDGGVSNGHLEVVQRCLPQSGHRRAPRQVVAIGPWSALLAANADANAATVSVGPVWQP